MMGNDSERHCQNVGGNAFFFTNTLRWSKRCFPPLADVYNSLQVYLVHKTWGDVWRLLPHAQGIIDKTPMKCIAFATIFCSRMFMMIGAGWLCGTMTFLTVATTIGNCNARRDQNVREDCTFNHHTSMIESMCTFGNLEQWLCLDLPRPRAHARSRTRNTQNMEFCKQVSFVNSTCQPQYSMIFMLLKTPSPLRNSCETQNVERNVGSAPKYQIHETYPHKCQARTKTFSRKSPVCNIRKQMKTKLDVMFVNVKCGVKCALVCYARLSSTNLITRYRRCKSCCLFPIVDCICRNHW